MGQNTEHMLARLLPQSLQELFAKHVNFLSDLVSTGTYEFEVEYRGNNERQHTLTQSDLLHALQQLRTAWNQWVRLIITTRGTAGLQTVRVTCSYTS